MDIVDNLLNTEKMQSLQCESCKGWLVLEEVSFVRVIEGVEVTTENLPVLNCGACKLMCLPDVSKQVILHHVSEAKNAQKRAVRVFRRAEAKQERFGYCPKVDFLYDATDYSYLPGLFRSHGRKGFLTPVFFNKTVLLKYMNHPEYVVELGSDTYGSIFRSSEHMVAFGINRSGKVIMWLGDIEQMPDEEQYYLRSENVPSDHDIGSEFYLGQIEAVFTDYSQEHHLYHLRSEFGTKCLKDYELKLSVYDLEVFDLMAEVVRPVTWGEKEVRGVVEALNKILVESLNNDGLRKNILALKPGEEVKSLKGMKLLQKWLGIAYPSVDAGAALCPFFVLYDFRIVAAHLAPADSAEKMLASCFDRMGLAEGARSYEALYDALVAGLIQSYRVFIGASKPTP